MPITAPGHKRGDHSGTFRAQARGRRQLTLIRACRAYGQLWCRGLRTGTLFFDVGPRGQPGDVRRVEGFASWELSTALCIWRILGRGPTHHTLLARPPGASRARATSARRMRWAYRPLRGRFPRSYLIPHLFFAPGPTLRRSFDSHYSCILYAHRASGSLYTDRDPDNAEECLVGRR